MWRSDPHEVETERIRRDLLEINLAGVDLEPLRAMIAAERNRWVVRKRGRSRFGPAPVRVLDEVVQIEWRGPSVRTTPALDEAIARLGAVYRVAPAVTTEIGRPSEGPGPEHDAQLLEHVDRAERLDAIRLAQRLYGLSLTEANRKIDEMSGRTEPAAQASPQRV
jgi:hypothetical protein